MLYDLFLDDIRELDYIFPITISELSCKGQKKYKREEWNWKIARTYDEAIDLILKFGVPRMMTLDHDLGLESKTGKDFLNKLVEMDLDGKIDLSKVERFTVHSSNINGRDNMLSLWSNFMKERYGSVFI
jgi:hypothetical protein